MDHATAFEEIRQLIAQAQRIAVCAHVDPDGDAIGSSLAMAWAARQINPGADVSVLLANHARVSATYSFMPGAQDMLDARQYEGAPDLFISVDTPTPERLGNAEAVFAAAARTVALDHHVSMIPFAQVNVKVVEAASVGDVVFDFIVAAGLQPPVETAENLLTAIVTDTGRFQYQNSNGHALKAAAQLVDWGARPDRIAAEVYQNNTLTSLHVRALAMQRLALDVSGRVAFSYMLQDDLKVLGATTRDCEGLIDTIRQLGGVDACAMLTQRLDGSIRVNLRSKVDWLDVSEVAAEFGGGGHKAAAGLSFAGSMEEAIAAVVPALSRAVAAGPGTHSGAGPAAGSGGRSMDSAATPQQGQA